MSLSARKKFTKVKPEEKLGLQHESLEAFRKAADFVPEKEKKYTLVLVTEPAKQRILLGQKHRGFGMGMYNSFGGKIEPGETDAESARRELQEETGILVPLHVMSNAKVGVLHFTFADSPTKMTVHLFRTNVTTSDKENSEYANRVVPLDPTVIRGCDEITPHWYEDWHDIPLNNMFADDSVWLTHLLEESKHDLSLDGYFHFHAGGQETNEIMHYFVDARSKVGAFTLEKRLFHELHHQRVRSPNIKEFKESYAFVNAVRKMFGNGTEFDLVVDVAGGHGAIAALFLAVNAARQAVVVDPANVGGGSVQAAWNKYLEDKVLRYRYEGLGTGLPDELLAARKSGIRPDRILVVACHACQHLSDETLQIACEFGVHAAVMPCCQRDLSPGGVWKVVSKRLGIPMEMVMDIILAGKVMSWSVGQAHQISYDVRMKVLEGSSTPQNRLILCRADSSLNQRRQEAKASAQDQLDKAYQRAHALSSRNKAKAPNTTMISVKYMPLLGSFCLGVAVTAIALRR